MPFSFKQFHVDDRQCGMPVSTDAVLLGAWAQLPDAGHIVDIGTGSGILALMCAQRTQATITALELDPAAAQQAEQNFAASRWADRLEVIPQAVQEWWPSNAVDAIICNPPYFTSGERTLKCDRRALARHHDGLSHTELLAALARLLSPQGCASLILPVAEATRLTDELARHGLHLHRYCSVQTTANKPAQRALLAIARQPGACVQDTMLIRQSDGQYSEAFSRLTENFYLHIGSQRR
ncbi:tRNA1(Val) (adenine(37)-N6)-methyltransferase [Ferrimonas pelagia]|uniref:tRNA1(Val) (adenine(37)-N6)-methyltransferase n=1 Tax=Ferrimonas pelagia TaxID=1177826 RepID=A0ABP9EIJ5_9GAMM